VMLIDII